MSNFKRIITYYYKHPKRLVLNLLNRIGALQWLSDEQCVRLAWNCNMDTPLNLASPKTFNEKLQWLKLHYDEYKYTSWVDKYEVKKLVAQVIGEEHIIPTYGVWDKFEDIDVDKLPNQFVLKCTHDSGGIVICRDKNKLDKQKVREKINNCLKRNYFTRTREIPYKHVRPRILAEQFMDDKKASVSGLTDYKFFCFNGKPHFLYLSQGMEDHQTARISFFDLEGNFCPFSRSDYMPLDKFIRPEHFDVMKDIASHLAQYFLVPFLRVDLYEINGKIYFSELTFFPCGGCMPLQPSSADKELGDMISLPEESIL